MNDLQDKIINWSEELGFQQLGFSDIDLSSAEIKFQQWIKQKMHGEMAYMSQHGLKRTRADLLEPGTLSVISVRMNYYSEDTAISLELLNQQDKAYISRYALGRDYHKLMRKRLQSLAKKIEKSINSSEKENLLLENLNYRVFVDSAPILEKPFAEKAGLGWIGKHTNLINPKSGSYFFIGEIYTNIPLKLLETSTQSKPKKTSHCGRCTDCIQACPTDAIVSPYVVDARKCISYLTIELKGSIPIEFRSAIGNRIYGCDDCQLVCPWNRFTQQSQEEDFKARYNLDNISLLELFSWTEGEFLKRFEGSPIRRIGYQSWLRNISIALGNTLANSLYQTQHNTIIKALQQKLSTADNVVKEHIQWALEQQLGQN